MQPRTAKSLDPRFRGDDGQLPRDEQEQDASVRVLTTEAPLRDPQGLDAPVQDAPPTVLALSGIDIHEATALLARYGLKLARVPDDAPIPGSYWGEPEAGIVGDTVFARGDTPVHSLLHEAAHIVVLPQERRAAVHTDATDSIEEEDAVLVLQALLADELAGVGRARMCADMDAWGYTFRLGSARAYVEHDADSAWKWLAARGLVDAATRTLRLP